MWVNFTCLGAIEKHGQLWYITPIVAKRPTREAIHAVFVCDVTDVFTARRLFVFGFVS